MVTSPLLMNNPEKLNNILFYGLDKAIKTYRQFAQRNITKAGFDITIDQWLVLKTLQENPEATQQELAISAFKDFASVTRIIELLVSKKYLDRSAHLSDRRRFRLTITDAGIKILTDVQPVIMSNRSTALEGIKDEDIALMSAVLGRLVENCQR